MIFYLQCSACGYQYKVAGNLETKKCPKCGGEQWNMEGGSTKPPAWWIEPEPQGNNAGE